MKIGRRIEEKLGCTKHGPRLGIITITSHLPLNVSKAGFAAAFAFPAAPMSMEKPATKLSRACRRSTEIIFSDVVERILLLLQPFLIGLNAIDTGDNIAAKTKALNEIILCMDIMVFCCSAKLKLENCRRSVL
jgi:hypothetical protein